MNQLLRRSPTSHTVFQHCSGLLALQQRLISSNPLKSVLLFWQNFKLNYSTFPTTWTNFCLQGRLKSPMQIPKHWIGHPTFSHKLIQMEHYCLLICFRFYHEVLLGLFSLVFVTDSFFFSTRKMHWLQCLSMSRPHSTFFVHQKQHNLLVNMQLENFKHVIGRK